MLERLPARGRPAPLERGRGAEGVEGDVLLPSCSGGGTRRPRPQLGGDLRASVRGSGRGDVGTKMVRDERDRYGQKTRGRQVVTHRPPMTRG